VREPGELIACLPEELALYKALAEKQSINRIMEWLSAAQEILVKMSRSIQRRAELEAGLLRMTVPAFGAKDSVLLERIETLEKKLERKTKPEAPAQPEPVVKRAPEPPVAKLPMEPFGQWNQVLEELFKKNKALHGTLVDSTAYISGDLLLVDAGADSMFSGMVRGDSYAKESLCAAVEAVTGKRYKLGPYNPEQYEVKSNKREKLEEILKQAGALGVDIQVDN